MTSGGKFEPGRSGNPAGKARGTRNRTTEAVEALLDGQASALTQKAIDLALDGDGPALRLCLDRLCPPRKDRHVPFALPAITSAADAVKASAALVAAVAAGELTPGEAGDFGKLIETVLRGIELTDVQDRLARLEASTT